MNLANKLTVFRMILVPIMVIIPFLGIDGEFLGIPLTYWLVDLVFVIGAFTDKLDGYIARNKNQITTFGKFLDPIADKILVNLAFLALTVLGAVPVWVFAVVLVRDLLVNGLRMFAAKNHIVLEASLLGKFKTTFQMVALGVILFGLIVNIGLVTTIGNILLYISLIMAIISGAAYFYSSRKLFSK